MGRSRFLGQRLALPSRKLIAALPALVLRALNLLKNALLNDEPSPT